MGGLRKRREEIRGAMCRLKAIGGNGRKREETRGQLKIEGDKRRRVETEGDRGRCDESGGVRRSGEETDGVERRLIAWGWTSTTGRDLVLCWLRINSTLWLGSGRRDGRRED